MVILNLTYNRITKFNFLFHVVRTNSLQYDYIMQILCKHLNKNHLIIF